jgi:hypothetical protein
VGPDGADDERAGDGAPAETVTAPAGSEPVPAILDLTAGEQGQEPRDEASEVQVITTPEDDEAREHPAEPAAVGVAASVSTGSFGRWMEETSQGPAGSEPEDAPEAESESDGRSLRELFWGED